MAELIPLKGVRYNTAKAGNLQDLVTPPYDVIDAAAQNMYYERNPYNVIRLELGKTSPADTDTDNRYTRSAANFREWLGQGILAHDEQPSLYLYEQEFEARGQKITRTGFLTGLKAEDYSKGWVLPHEETLPKHKADRLLLLKSALANFSPIFGLYSDPELSIDTLLAKAKAQPTPDVELTDDSGVINRLWVISDQAVVAQVVKLMAEKKIYIADGHHRYETAVNFGREMAEQGKPGYDIVLIALVNLYDKGLVVFPTHRLVNNIPNLNIPGLLENLSTDFTVETLPAGTTLDTFLTKLEDAGKPAPSGAQNHAFGIYTQEKRFYVLTLKDEAALDQLELENRSAAWRRLDVSILHTLILEQHLGIGSRQRAEESNLTYTRDEDFAIEAVDNGSNQLCFFMNPTLVEEVTNIAQGGEKMPQKSTYFYPKIVTGIVINDFTR
ncbi:MAG TPA: DUF1015 domain-containing protein [Bacillota bacterium]|nr:DUF1015 domain-containing protein [Bacillota bacterium]